MRNRTLAIVTLLVALLLVASTCGGDEESTPTDDSTTTSAASTTDGSAPSDEPITCDAPDPQLQLDEVAGYISAQLMAEYQIVRHDDAYLARYCWHDWTTDDCSVPIGKDTSVAQDFVHPCHRHDFGYRNFKRLETATGLDVWTEATKLVVDDQLLEDTREVCAPRAFYQKQVCLGWAQVFYWAVRAFGGFQDELLN